MASRDTPLSAEDVLKSIGTTEEKDKLKLLAAKYDELLQLCRSQENALNASKREVTSVTNDKNKQLLARSRLEGCCRELQKQNNALKEELAAKIQEADMQRKNITQDFQKTLNNVTNMMTESNLQNTKLGEENRQMAERLSLIYEEFKSRESEVERISKQIDIERQLGEARCSKLQTEFLIDKHQLAMENDALNVKIQGLTQELIESSTRCVHLERQVAELTAQIDKYSGKYEEFENTISKSGRVFDHVKTELSRMTKQVKSLEREVIEWQTRYHRSVTSNYELQLEMAEKKRALDESTRKQTQLMKLCRQIQVERKAYLNTLRELGTDPSQIIFDTIDETVEELTAPPVNLPATSTDLDESRFGAKHKQSGKSKKTGKKAKKGKEAVFETSTPLTQKEIQLAELKQELHRVQQLMKIQTELSERRSADGGEVGTNKNNEVAERISPVCFTDVTMDRPIVKTDADTIKEIAEAAGFVPLSQDERTQFVVYSDSKDSLDTSSDIEDEACCIKAEIIEHNPSTVSLLDPTFEENLDITAEERMKILEDITFIQQNIQCVPEKGEIQPQVSQVHEGTQTSKAEDNRTGAAKDTKSNI